MQNSTDNNSSEKNNASSSSTATTTSSAFAIIEEDLKNDPTPLRRHERMSEEAVDDDGDEQPKGAIKWGDSGDNDGDEALSRRSKAQKDRRKFRHASATGRSRMSYIMRLAKMASSKLNVSGSSIKETEAAE